MPAPELMSFGDEDHQSGETGLVVDGGGFGFAGTLWIYANSDRTGASDQLTVGAYNDIQLTGVEIPVTPNNTTGTRYLFLQREDLAWSNSLAFALTVGPVIPIIPSYGYPFISHYAKIAPFIAKGVGLKSRITVSVNRER